MYDADIPQVTRILLVEDNEINQQLVVMFFKIIGISVEVASDGEKAIELLKQKKKVFDLVFMDCQMPVMDGYETTKQLRQIELFNKLPIIAMSAHVFPRDREKAFGAGMNDYITKPIDFNDVLKKMKKWIPQ